LRWMPEALRILRDELPNIDVMISSQYSPLLADGLVKGKIDAAFLRRKRGMSELAYRVLVKEFLMVVLPDDHRLAALKSISPKDLVDETFVAVSNTAPVLRAIIDKYLKRSGVDITPDHEADHVSIGMSLIASTGGVGLLPTYAQNFLPPSVTSRPLKGDVPTIELVLGYKKSNPSPILKLLLSRLDELSLVPQIGADKPKIVRSQGLTFAFAPRSSAKRRSADGNLAFIAAIRPSVSLALMSSSSKASK
jgi:LysR family transcriptional regulator, hca operon transcriptional activator